MSLNSNFVAIFLIVQDQIYQCHKYNNFWLFNPSWFMPFMSLITFLWMDKMDRLIKMFKGYFNTLNLCTENNIIRFKFVIFKFNKVFTSFSIQMLSFISGSFSILLNLKFPTLKMIKITANILNKLKFD